MMKKIILTIMILFIVGAFSVYYYTQRDSRNDIRYMEAVEDISATSLLESYDMNEGSANDRFLGKVISVSGKILSITNELQETTIYLDTGNPMSSVVCEMNSNIQADFSNIKEGQDVSVKGELSGKLLDIILVNCILNQ